MRNAAEINAALTYVDQAMSRSAHIAQKAVDEHLQAFQMQMREKVGVDEIALNEPYLPQLQARFESQYLARLENVKRAIVSVKSFSPSHMEYKALDSEEPLMPQVEARVNDETNRFNLEAKQDLDGERQQAFGVKKYIWDASGEACPICAPLDGQIFTWGEGDEPGGIHPNCQCSAEPVLEDAGDPKAPPPTKPTVTESGRDVVIHKPDGTTETRSGGTRAWRNNNPGNIRAGKFADQHGAIGSAGGFAVFPDEATGKAASEDLLKTPSYSKLTIDEAIARRSPSTENETGRLQNDIHKIGGFNGDEVVGELNDEQMDRLVEAIKRTEGWKEGTVTQGP